MNTSRRLFLFAAAAAAPAFALPAIASPVPADTTALRLWAERQASVERLNELTTAYCAARANLPAWAAPGLDRIDQDGNACGDYVGWPLDTSVTPPQMGCYRFVRPSLRLCREQFEFEARVFDLGPVSRAKSRAAMRARMRSIIARLHERHRLYEELGLTELNRQIEATTDTLIEAEDYFHECEDETPNIVAARLLMDLINDCQRDAIASGNGYCGTMAMALVALKGLLPNLSGLIRDHAAFFVGNPTLPLSAMPFAPL
jgi:hypothetical protein